jgi:hypothetical protein
MDDELTLHELARLEAERKARTLPATILETAWVREAQIEAVIDAVLVVGLGDARAVARARHTGEWAAKIAAALPEGVDPALARRVGALLDVETSVLERIPELRHIAKRGQAWLVACVAREFETRIAPDERGRYQSPRAVLQAMRANADAESRPIVEALERAVQPARNARVA